MKPAPNCTCFYSHNGSCKMLPRLGHMKNGSGVAAMRIELCVECWYMHKCNVINVYEKKCCHSFSSVREVHECSTALCSGPSNQNINFFKTPSDVCLSLQCDAIRHYCINDCGNLQHEILVQIG